MSGRMTLIDLELEHSAVRRKYAENAWTFLSRMKQVCKKLDSSCRLMVFGSFIKGDMKPDSDIDVLLIARLAENPLERGRLFRAITEEIGLDNPFEIHMVTEEEFENLYKKFIDVYEEVL
jgi:predicted nucleotidyltransferase